MLSQPDQLARFELIAGDAVRVTFIFAPLVKEVEQLPPPPQFIPPTSLIIIPSPVPNLLTFNNNGGGGGKQLPAEYEEVEQSVFLTVHWLKSPPYWQYCGTQEVDGVQVGGGGKQLPVVYEEVEQLVFLTVHIFRSPPYWQYCGTQEVDAAQVGGGGGGGGGVQLLKVLDPELQFLEILL